jgi:hypothetical protein
MKITYLFVVSLSFFMLLNANAQNFEWAKSTGGTSYDKGTAITTDDLNNVYSVGYFEGTVDFDPGPGVFNLTSAGSKDVFISKLDVNGNLIWAKNMGGTGYDAINSVATDNVGNVYTTGFFRDVADFDPSAGVFNLTSAGGKDIFISKLDSNGDFVWAKSIGSVNDEQGNGIAIDGSGNVYSTGIFEATVDFNPGAGTVNLVSQGQDDVFVSKLDPNGGFVWAKSFGGSSTDGVGEITIDNADNVYTTGSYKGIADFDPGAGTLNLTSEGYTDIFVSKLDDNGNLIWVKSMGGPSNDSGQGIAVDNSGNVHTVGLFKGTSDFDPGANSNSLTSEGESDIFISKLDNSGNFVWIKSFGASSFDFAYGITLDAVGNVYTTGHFKRLTDFDPGPGAYYLNSNSLNDYEIFISKLDALGDFVWATRIGEADNDYGFDIALSSNNDVYTTGNYAGTVDFDPGTGSSLLTSEGSFDAYVLKLGQCTNTTSSINTTVCDSYTVPSGDETYTSGGTFNDTIPNSTGCDSIITINLTVNYSETATDIITSCDSYAWIDGNTYTSSNNTATHTLTNAVGCDSVVTLDLTINNSSTGIDQQTACDSYTWIDGNTYTSSNNTVTHTLTNAAGCDSVVTLNLTVNYSSTGIDQQTACETYTWIDGNTYTSSNNTATHTLTNALGCDSVVTLDLTVNYSSTGIDQQTACETYTWIDGNTYTSSNNTATHTLTNAAGCDSVVTLDLTIPSIDVSVTNNDPTLTADEAGANYQWIDCNDNDSPISGETSQSFTPSSNGSYAVIVSKQGCSDTSTCYTVATVNLKDLKADELSLIVYPNPSTGIFNIKSADTKEIRYTLTDIRGNKIREGRLSQGENSIDLMKQPKGIYFFRTGRYTLRLVKQ